MSSFLLSYVNYRSICFLHPVPKIELTLSAGATGSGPAQDRPRRGWVVNNDKLKLPGIDARILTALYGGGEGGADCADVG